LNRAEPAGLNRSGRNPGAGHPGLPHVLQEALLAGDGKRLELGVTLEELHVDPGAIVRVQPLHELV
jgi:hypothetical protein